MYGKKHLDFKRFLPFIFVLLLLICAIILGIYGLKSITGVKYDDAILGSPYISAKMPVPTATPAPTLPPGTALVKPDYEAELVSVYNEPGKNVYLTFDDGPTANITPQILDILKEKGVCATFFVLGVNVEKNPEIARRLAEEGHAIANHSYSHDYKKLYNGTDFFVNDVLKTESVIKSTAGEDRYVKVFRFPGGSFEKSKNPQKNALKNIDYKFLDWNSLNGDAEALNVPPEKLMENIKKTTKGKRNAVILMHDAATKQTTVDSLREVIDYLKAEGFTFKTLKDIPIA